MSINPSESSSTTRSKRRSTPRSAAQTTRLAIAAERREAELVRSRRSEIARDAAEGGGNGGSNGVSTPHAPPEADTLSPPGDRDAVAAKIFVLDTNVLLHDPTAVERFEEHDLYIPITVLEEVDRFKKGPDTLNFHAREIARRLDELAPHGALTSAEGVSLGEDRGVLRVIVGGELHPSVARSFSETSPDHRILSAACKVRDTHGDREVVLVSKDVSLRLKARSLGLAAEDYESDKVPDLDKLYKGRFELEGLDPGIIDRFYQPPYGVPLVDLAIEEPHPNAYFVLKGGGGSALARYDRISGHLVRVEKRSGFGIQPRNAEQTFALDALTNPDIQLLTLSGKAGTGKTLLALAGALEVRRRYEQIYLARPVVPLGRQELGYLPGDIGEKLGPYMQPLWDNLTVIRGQYKHSDPNYQKIQQMLDTEKLKINALAYIRGRSLNRIFFIVDEAQNLTPHEVKTIITRAGEGSKIVLTGDPQQIDSPYLDSRSNGLTRLIDRMRGQDLYAHVTLERGERSRLSDLASSLL